MDIDLICQRVYLQKHDLFWCQDSKMRHCFLDIRIWALTPSDRYVWMRTSLSLFITQTSSMNLETPRH